MNIEGFPAFVLVGLAAVGAFCLSVSLFMFGWLMFAYATFKKLDRKRAKPRQEDYEGMKQALLRVFE